MSIQKGAVVCDACETVNKTASQHFLPILWSTDKNKKFITSVECKCSTKYLYLHNTKDACMKIICKKDTNCINTVHITPVPSE